MRVRSTTCRSLDELRTTLRRAAYRAGVEPDLRSRLVLSASRLAAADLAAGRAVSLEVVPAPRGAGAALTVRLSLPGRAEPSDLDALPLPARPASAGVAWTLPLPEPGAARRPAAGPGADRPDPVALLEEETAFLTERLDHLAREHQRLKDELAETNSGVLALYVQLEERDEQLRKAHGRMLRQLEDALRPPPVEVPGLEMAVRYEPAESHAPTGGDLYDWFTLPDGTVHITLVDALGHGLTSTRGALNVTHAVRTLALEGHGLGTLVARAADALAAFDQELMATVQVVRVDPHTGELRLANGSHPPALLVRRDGATRFLEAAGRGVGFPLPGSEEVLRDRLGPGDLLVLYTDGLTESRRDPHEGEQRLAEAARRHRHLPMEEVPGALAEEMHTVILHPDDTVALAVRRATGAY
ncbi:serine/threonine-protein phosphatase [Streptomyces somaliensis DSM 40738]|uniref:Serine/threonine-protein phosphatase n=1 Tax=Streptomyces somaliensis (strain ATCC 33201 / DSM 40738 / JCM 12659 / KCTC 9044 / NCTC 11332 / NRRL B-12077 / IP 733) TaxID=1134445 RepID=A0AA44DGB1_STRE0|nr:PP2C family protein-serine/threonine phosphatase [Streptomyces somaliensis]MCQ0021930.1 serine/threonine-protein phosphatase [Streptomyces somaliensis DSM 40738]NKY15717.1 serine/threonine-protein phosphatase [Streptomyces somaliensis DSM 40738]